MATQRKASSDNWGSANGTNSRLVKNASSIRGVVVLTQDDPESTPDSLSLSLRLPERFAELTSVIFHQTEHDAKHPPASKQNRRKPSPTRRVIEPSAHQSHRLNDAQTIRQAPAKQSVVPRRHEDARTAERLRRRDERLQVHVALCRRMAEERQVAGVSGDPTAAPSPLYHLGSDMVNYLCRIVSAIYSVHLTGHSIPSLQIARLRWSHRTAGHTPLEGSSLHARQRLPDIET